MSSGGVAQLVAIGAQDAFITGKPEVSFFQSSYKRHTNFAQVVDRQVIQGTPTPGGMSTVRFERRGDMMGFVYLAPIGSTGATSVNDWTTIISSVEFYIGGQLIDAQDSFFCETLAPQLFAQNMSKSTNGGGHIGGSSYFYPLRFTFCENAQSALPLVALQYHDVEIRIYWGSDWLSDGVTSFDVYTQYIFLDESERKYMADKEHTMLITQVQKMTPSNLPSQDITFNHPIKYLASYDVSSDPDTGDPIYGALTSTSNKVILKINGSDIGDYKYATPNYTDVMMYYYTPYTTTSQSIFLYPFCLDTAKLQPTGTLNFSRLDSVRLVSSGLPITTTIYGVNYNILKIQGGMGGLMYSN